MSLLLRPERYLGEARRRRDVAGLALTETVHAQPAHLPLHTHPRAYFCFVLDGGFDERVGDRMLEARPGTLLFHPAGETHTDEIRSPRTTLLNIAFAGAWERRLAELEPRQRPHPGRQRAHAARIARRIASEVAECDPVSDLAIEGLVLVLLADAARGRHRHHGAPPHWLPAVVEFIRTHFRNAYDHDALARIAGVHPTHFARAFRSHMGCTVGSYVRGLRIGWARERLAHGDEPVVHLALEAGFADHAHFTRWFRRETGVTPSAYRRLHRSRN